MFKVRYNSKASLHFKLLFFVLSVSINSIHAQPGTITLDECYKLATENYPLAKSKDLIGKSGEYNVKNINSGYLPSLTIAGQYTYQSDVTKIPFNIPGMEVPAISQDQYKIYADLSQVVYDGGALSLQKRISRTQTEIDQQSLEVELFKVKERINQIYFGILLLNQQIEQVEVLKKEINAGLKKAENAFTNGTMLKSGVDALKAELLKTDARIAELTAGRDSYVEMLSLFTGSALNSSTVFRRPEIIAPDNKINRPEIALFNSRNRLVNVQSDAILVKNLPKVNLFIQGGYGSPALNMLNPDADTYYIGGIRFTWPLANFYNFNRDKEITKLARLTTDIQKETFLFNTRLQLVQQMGELVKLNELIKTDDEIIDLRETISQSSLLQLENGVITSADYIREVTAAENARQLKALHEIQYLMARYNYQFITGN